MNARQIVVLTVVLGLAIGYAILRDRLPALGNLEAASVDLRYILRGERPIGDEVAILLVDDASIAELGRWPLSREILARALDRLGEGKPRVVAFDMLFSERQADPPVPLRKALGSIVSGLPEDDLARQAVLQYLQVGDVDARFAASIATAGNVVVPFAFLARYDSGPGRQGKPGSAADPPFFLQAAAYRHYVLSDRNGTGLPLAPGGILGPVPEIGSVAAALGHVQAFYEYDGNARFDYPVLADGEWLYPSLPVAIAATFLGVGMDNVRLTLPGELRIADLRIPLDRWTRMPVNHAGAAGRYPTYSFADLVQGRLDPAVFQDRIVLVGASALGLNDAFRTPFTALLPGAERYATLIDQILQGITPRTPPWGMALELVILILGGSLLGWITTRISTGLAAGAAIALVAGWWLFQQLLFSELQIVLGVVAPTAAFVLVFLSLSIDRIWAEERRRRRAEDDLRRSEERYALATRGANDGLWDWDINAGSLYVSDRWRGMVGALDEDKIVTMEGWTSWMFPEDRADFRAQLDVHLRGETGQFDHDYRVMHSDGQPRWMRARGVAVRDGKGRPVRMAGSQTDITEAKRMEEEISHGSLYDRLTDLPNRVLLKERLGQALARQDGGAAPAVALFYVDLDRFTLVNDSLGYAAGDRVLNAVGRRLRNLVGKTETLSRVGGNEYALLIEGIHDDAGALRFADRIQEALSMAHAESGRRIVLTASIGYVLAGRGVEDAEAAIRASRLAMLEAKGNGGARTCGFDQNMQSRVTQRLNVESELRHAIGQEGELLLHYQPIVRLTDGQIAGFESLMRWRHPERGFVSPAEFIPLAEETGLIVELGQRALILACVSIARWNQRYGAELWLSVNVSARQLAEGVVGLQVRQALKESGARPGHLKIELTESVAMANPEAAISMLQDISETGVKISIDDFGTGHSSLAYIHRLPFDLLKIDRFFTSRLSESREGMEIVETIAALGHNLGRELVAEGIENRDQLAALRDLPITYGQGFYFGRPMPEDVVIEVLDRQYGLAGAARKA